MFKTMKQEQISRKALVAKYNFKKVEGWRFIFFVIFWVNDSKYYKTFGDANFRKLPKLLIERNQT